MSGLTPRRKIGNDAALYQGLIGKARAVQYPVDETVAARAERTVVYAGIRAGVAVFEFHFLRVYGHVIPLTQKIALEQGIGRIYDVSFFVRYAVT